MLKERSECAMGQNVILEIASTRHESVSHKYPSARFSPYLGLVEELKLLQKKLEMKICMISRPSPKKTTKKFRTEGHYILKRIELMGHEVQSLFTNPLGTPNLYLAYRLGIALSPFRFRNIKPDSVLADDLEPSAVAVLIRFVSAVFARSFTFSQPRGKRSVIAHRQVRIRKKAGLWPHQLFNRVSL